MSEFTIIIKGVAASYIKDDAWKVLFPFNECHAVRFSVGVDPGLLVERAPIPGMILGQQGVRIEISVSDPLTRTSEGTDYDDFLDLTGDGVHDALEPRFDIADMNAVMMSIDGAQMSPLDHVEAGCRLMNRDGSSSPKTPFQKTGNYGKAFIEGTELTIRVTGPDINFSSTFSEDTTVVFDNDCIEQPIGEFGDIDMLYNVLSDADQGSIKFMVEKDPSNGVTGGVGGVAAHAGSNGTVTVATADGLIPENPGRGLPCNMFQISKPGRLPS
jgi:hypothetical protein